MKKLIFLECPLCGLSRPLVKTLCYATKRHVPPERILGEKPPSRFDVLDPGTAPFIDIRETGGGRGFGFRRIIEECLTLAQAMGTEEYRDLVEQVRQQCHRILKAIEGGKSNAGK